MLYRWNVAIKIKSYLDSFELEIEYTCRGADRTSVKDGTCQEDQEDEGKIFVVNGKCPGPTQAIEEEVRCGNNVFLRCRGGCLRC